MDNHTYGQYTKKVKLITLFDHSAFAYDNQAKTNQQRLATTNTTHKLAQVDDFQHG